MTPPASHEAITGPHTYTPLTVDQIMRWVIIALLPATLFGLFIYGWPAFNLLIITILSALFWEALCLKLASRPIKPALKDSSAVLTAWLLAMSMPPWSPWWLAVLGGFIAIVIGKQVFGGLGQNIFNPAMLARVTLLVAFPVEMTTWITPEIPASASQPDFLQGLQITFTGIPQIEAVSGATVLSHIKTELTRGEILPALLEGHYTPLFSTGGFTRGSMGETSAVLIFLGGMVLLYKKIISWHIPFAVLGSVVLFSSFLHLSNPSIYADPYLHLMSGGLMLCAFFIATDMVTSPATGIGQIIFGVGCGLIIVLIRSFGGFPEGAGFGVLLMNAATPLIDHYTRPRIYGRRRSGDPLPVPDRDEKK